MITVEKFLQCVQENAARVTHYEKGGDGSGGGCDCIGLIIGALRLAGEKWTGTHGSNWAARNAIQGPWPHKITGENVLQPGDIVFKVREKNDSGYDLPDSYKDSGDSRDFYHVGVVMSVNPFTIMHCTSVEGGIKEDHSLGNWSHYAKLKGVTYPGQEGKDEVLYYARVYAANGQPVRIRPQPNTDRDEICKVPVNMVVAVLDDSINGWDKVEYTGIIGYMMSEFLVPLGSTGEHEDIPQQEQKPEEKPEWNYDTVTVTRDELAEQRRKLDEVRDWINRKMEG